MYKGIFKKMFLVLALIAAMLLGAFGVSAETCALVLSAPSDATVKLYQGFFASSGRTEVAASSKQTADGVTTYTFDVAAGKYHYTAKGTGYYTINKNIKITESFNCNFCPCVYVFKCFCFFNFVGRCFLCFLLESIE